jgi:hypothetical protein
MYQQMFLLESGETVDNIWGVLEDILLCQEEVVTYVPLQNCPLMGPHPIVSVNSSEAQIIADCVEEGMSITLTLTLLLVIEHRTETEQIFSFGMLWMTQLSDWCCQNPPPSRNPNKAPGTQHQSGQGQDLFQQSSSWYYLDYLTLVVLKNVKFQDTDGKVDLKNGRYSEAEKLKLKVKWPELDSYWAQWHKASSPCFRSMY